MDKNFFWLLMTALIGVFVWGGFSIYFAMTDAEINPNAESYTTPISKTFDTDTIDMLKSSIEDNLPVQPEELRAYESLGE